ncbi:hypothetical protein GYMLUDRAFT_49799 [Collybiopsis luxurians FD-317 M1]|uniref:Uncharacterized protein n=1 Tax=Collybiopsis luxurians FD-317 M1 TaxID=944289 RepID=A0A0D0BSP8_9AGAR|nr:hypothetical protein GYMLUDRAFT_49799 [Collybiopsis luxurians FD-317 M1]
MNTFLAAPQRKLSNLETEISRLQERLRALSSECERAKAYLDAHHALMSAILQRFSPKSSLTAYLGTDIPSEA